jgi:phospholipid/cholesterol/gamma-HCH transport system substrate-binding protein
MRGAAELRVGVFAVVAISAAVYFSMATTDNPFKTRGYVLKALVPTAAGLQPGSSVEMAGVRIGAINEVGVHPGGALLEIGMDPVYQLPIDSMVQVTSRGMLGDTVLKVISGVSDTMAPPGFELKALAPPPTLPELQAQIGGVAEDLKVITGSLRSILSSEHTLGSIDAILSNVQAFTHELSGIARDNRGNLDEVIENMRVLSEQLALLAADVRPEVKSELLAIRAATDTLNRSLESVESIAAKIDRGEGSIGMLINDDRLAVSLTETVEEVGNLIDSVGRFQIEVYYRGEFHVTHRPPNAQFSGKNVIGLRVKPRPDYWYVFEFVDDPVGSFSEETVFVDDGSGFRSVREVRNTRKSQFSFMFAKRWRDLVLRLGIKENSGGLGADLILFDDHLSFSLDVYDFLWASWPDRNGIPNVKLAADISPIKNVYVTVGADNIVNYARRGEFNWFVGGGVWFTDNDIKWIVGSLPVGAL